jgi:hypothetical protein
MLVAGCATTKAGHLVGEAPHKIQCPSAPAVTTGTLKLLDAGRQPRKAVRIDVDKTTRQQATMGLAMHIATGDSEADAPVIQMPVSMTVTASCKAGFVYTARYGKPRVDPDSPNSAAMQQQMDQVNGMTLTSANDRTGHVLDSAFSKVPKSLSVGGTNPLNSIGDFNQAVVGFPSKPIGVGARWTAISQVDTGPAHLTVNSTWRLLSRTGDTLTLASAISEQAKPYSQTISGHKITISKLTGTGQSSLNVDLSKLIGTGTIHLKTHTEASADDGSSATTDLTMVMGIQ